MACSAEAAGDSSSRVWQNVPMGAFSAFALGSLVVGLLGSLHFAWIAKVPEDRRDTRAPAQFHADVPLVSVASGTAQTITSLQPRTTGAFAPAANPVGGTIEGETGSVVSTSLRPRTTGAFAPAANPEGGTITVLINTRSPQDMEELRTICLPSLEKHLAFEITVTILYEGPNVAALQGMLNQYEKPTKLTFSFVDVTRYWEVSADDLNMQRNSRSCPNSVMGYQKMCEFWTVHVQHVPELFGYRYIWRLDGDSILTQPVNTSLFDIMRAENLIYGFGIYAGDNAACCGGLAARLSAFYKQHPQWAPAPENKAAWDFISTFESKGCPLWNTNFMLMDLKWFRESEAYNAFVKTVVPGIMEHRWGDHIIQTIFLKTHVARSRYACMKPWVPGYSHQGGDLNCCGKELPCAWDTGLVSGAF